MATLTVTKVKCIRPQDVIGNDEAVVHIGGQQQGGVLKLDKGSSKTVSESESFTNSMLLQLKERNGTSTKNEKVLGSWTVYPTPVTDKVVTATSSGFEYEVTCSVA